MRYTILTILSMIPALLFGQGILSLRGVAGSYAMGDMEDLQMQIKEEFRREGVQLNPVFEFPASVQFELALEFKKGKRTIGGFFNLGSTEGKLHYQDHSGQFIAGQKLSRSMLGFSISQELSKGIQVYWKVGGNMSLLNMYFSSEINGGDKKVESLHFYSRGGSLEPGLRWDYNYKLLNINASAGYEFNVQGNTMYNNNSNTYLKNLNGGEVKMDWSGYRLGLGIGLVLK